MSVRRRTARGESGAALLVLLLVLMVASAGVLVTKANEARARLLRGTETQAALASAKRALVEFAATYPDRFPGQPLQLPCPDLDAGGAWLDGEAHTGACGAAGVTVLGRFPWRTTGGSIARDSSGSCLWYVVSGSYKSAGAATAAMINPDSNGQIQVFDAASGTVVGSGLPEDRAVGAILAPNAPLLTQLRAGVGNPSGCESSFAPADYLDGAAALGISNASLSGAANAVEQLVTIAAASDELNDGVLTISRRELADAVYRRPDFPASIDALTRGVASCIAAYGRSNPGGATDLRLPWPADVAMADYAAAAGYDDVDAGRFSGRLADVVDDSSSVTGNAIQRVLTDCNPALAPDWDPALLAAWQQWKDHFFYVVAESFQANAPVPTACGNCLSVNGGGAYAAIVLFAAERLSGLGQVRNSPPLDADTKRDLPNYLEGANAANHPYTGGAADFESAAAGGTFNDVLVCIDSAMNVGPC